MNAKIMSEIKGANVRFKKLIQDEIAKKKLIKTGYMIKSITSEFRLERGKITIFLGAVYYYKFLDNGTKFIKPYYITADTIKGEKFKKLEKELVSKIAGIEILEAIQRYDKPFLGPGGTYIIK